MVVVGRPALLGFGPLVRPCYGWVPFSWPHPSRDSLLCPQANFYPLEMPMCVFSNMAARSYIWHFSTWNMTNVTEKLKFLFSLILMQWKWQATCGNTLHSSSQLSDVFLRLINLSRIKMHQKRNAHGAPSTIPGKFSCSVSALIVYCAKVPAQELGHRASHTSRSYSLVEDGQISDVTTESTVKAKRLLT